MELVIIDCIPPELYTYHGASDYRLYTTRIIYHGSRDYRLYTTRIAEQLYTTYIASDFRPFSKR
jgi:hypothetical protein